MIIIFALIRRRPGLTHEEFVAYYNERHIPLFRSVVPAEVAASITRYVQNFAAQLPDRKRDQPYDCVTEFGFEDLEGMRRWTTWYRSDDSQALRDDELNFVDLSDGVSVVTERGELRPVTDRGRMTA